MRRRAVVAVVVAVIGVIGISSGAFAYWSSHGAGSGSSSTGTLQPVTVAAITGATPGSTLLPGGPPADVILKVTNNNAFAVTLVNVTGTGTIAADGGHSGCTTTGVTFTSQTSLATTIAASATTLVTLTGAATMSTASLSACQGATFTIPVSITVHK